MFSTLEMSIIAMIGTQEIIILALVILLLFGGKKIPELMKGLGKGVKSFKEGVNGIEDSLGDEKNDAKGPSGRVARLPHPHAHSHCHPGTGGVRHERDVV